MKFLVTGGAGFIGSHLTEALLRDGHEVSVADNLSTGSMENIAHLQENDNFYFYEGNILDYKLMLKLITSCDCVYHLAAAVGVKYVLEHPLTSLVTNVRGTEIIFELANIFEKKVFLASSSEVYGKDGSGALREDGDRVLGPVSVPRWGYSVSKAFDETLALSYHKIKRLQVVIARFFNICGPRQSPNYGMVIPRFVQQALKGEPITVYGDGKQTRTFTYIDDVISGIRMLMDNPDAGGEVFNLGSTQIITIEALAGKIRELCGSNSEIIYVPYQEAYSEDFEDMLYRVPDITKMTNLTGFTPKTSLDTMLKSIIDYHRKIIR
ncbi:MAG: GDP-mannose 4,6-dehydratase [Candidatus Omnitrophica bacterium]|nr:GDP-mannose 4,6-dehydratase [Candidatus Omnitrophota bacterium]